MSKQSIIVIGGGLGGLSAAISLAQKGYTVSLYEKNHHLGGKLNYLSKEGFHFDLGPSILTMKAIFEQLFTNAGKRMDDYVHTIELDLQWRLFFPDQTIIDLYGDLEKMEAKNKALSRKDIQEYKNYLEYAKKLDQLVEDGYLEHGLDNIRQTIKYHGLFKSLTSFDLTSTMYESITDYITNSYLVDTLAYFAKYVGSSPYRAPGVLNMMSYMQYHTGAWYVPGGMNQLAEALVKLGKESGVNFYTEREIIQLNHKNGQIKSAILSDGEEVQADLFVSNMEVIPAYKKLLGIDNNYINRLENKFEPAASGYVLHLGVKGQYPQLSHHNFFFSNDPKKNFAEIFEEKVLPQDPTIYLVNVNKTDPAQALPGHENLKLLPHIPHIQDQPFTEEDYQAFENRVLIKLEKMGLKNLRKNIVVKDRWIPEDIRDMYYSDHGAIYGTVSDKNLNKGFKNEKKSKLFDNLYFVGGTVNPGPGMPMVVKSGQQVAQMIDQNSP